MEIFGSKKKSEERKTSHRITKLEESVRNEFVHLISITLSCGHEHKLSLCTGGSKLPRLGDFKTCPGCVCLNEIEQEERRDRERQEEQEKLELEREKRDKREREREAFVRRCRDHPTWRREQARQELARRRAPQVGKMGSVSRDDVRAALIRVSKQDGIAAARTILATYGAQCVSGLAEDYCRWIVHSCERLLYLRRNHPETTCPYTDRCPHPCPCSCCERTLSNRKSCDCVVVHHCSECV